MRRLPAAFVLAAACAAWAACTTAYDGTSNPDGDAGAYAVDANASDASTVDAAIDGGLDDGSADAPSDGALPPGAISFEDFENGTTCGAWLDVETTTTPTTSEAYAGARSCRLCYDGSGTGAHAVRFAAAKGPGTYAFRAYVRRDMGDASTAAAQIYVQYDGGQDVKFEPHTLTNAWTLMEATQASTQDASSVVVWLYLTEAPGECYLFDDATITYQP